MDDDVRKKRGSGSRPKEPRVGCFCRCGAQWFGKGLVNSAAIIRDHQVRCGLPVSTQTFERIGHRIIWPSHWDDEERAAVRAASVTDGGHNATL